MRARMTAGWAVLAVLTTSGGCAVVSDGLTTPDRIDRPATDVPGQFTLADGTLNAGAACRNPLVDPRDRAALELVRSDRGAGDYRVPSGRYGVGPDELLRIDCTTGRAVGIVSER